MDAQKEWNNDEKYKVKIEFEGAKTIEHIAPYGNQLDFNEYINGGAHFFTYTEHFIHLYKLFIKTNEYKIVQILSDETHWWYRDVIEAFLFAYYAKFGDLNFSDVLAGITIAISKHRFNNSRSNLKSLFLHASNSEIILMINQAKSPTYFLAELLPPNNSASFTDNEYEGIRSRYAKKIAKILDSIKDSTHSNYSN